MYERLETLTQVMNKYMIDQSLKKIFHQDRSVLENLAIGFLAIDRCDALGSEAMEKAIQLVADIMSQSTRPNDLIGRYDQEKFLFILNGTDKDGALSYAERIRAEIEERGKMLRCHFNDHELTVSIGLLLYHAGYENHSEMLEIAAQTMRIATRQGSNRVQLLTDLSSTSKQTAA